MSDIFDDFNKIFKKDLLPTLVKYLKDPNNKISENLNEFINDPQNLLINIVEKFYRNADKDNHPSDFTDIKNVTDINSNVDDEYDNLLQRLILIEENMIEIEKILKNKN